MGVQWTDEQKKVIDLRNRNILVSAAAGSGKTAVLVERIIQMLMNKEHPLEVDQLLIVTFTEAAASEMKERIRNAIENALISEPGNVHLQRQATLIHSARITTIHSFCLSVIREHFHAIDLDPGFRIVEEGELQLLKQDVLCELLEEEYESPNPGFLELTEKLGGSKNDKKLEEEVLKLYEYSRSYPQPESWLKQCVDNYRAEGIENNVFFKKAEHYISKYLQDIKGVLMNCLKICEEPDGPYMYVDTLEKCIKMLDIAINKQGFMEMYAYISQMNFGRLSSKRDECVDGDKRQSVKDMMEQARKMLKDIKETYFYQEPEELLADMTAASETMEAFVDLVQKFSVLYAAKKNSKNMIDFHDMEQFALKILTKEVDGELFPSAVAREYQEQFVEIMIDEYQDSNYIQEAILTSVSRQSRGQNNVFMVGDVKQSIYRFRLSRPELFMDKYESYDIEESKCQRIDLHKNFRSRHEVLDSVNFIFKRIMKKEMGGVEYDDKAALYPGADFEKLVDEYGISINQTELILLDCEDSEEKNQNLFIDHKKNSPRQLEARIVAKKIKDLIRNHKVMDKQTGELRPVRYQDIVILTRSISGWADTFADILIEEGVPAYADSREGYFEAYEVSVLLDYLKLLDNQRQDLALTAVLTSPFAGLTSQDLAQIRMYKPDGCFFEAVEKFRKETKEEKLCEKLDNFYSNIERYRKMLPYTTIHELLWKIIDETGYGIYIAAMPGGEQRKANIEMLIEKAVAFESTSYKGLFHFVRYIEQLKKYNVDYGEANHLDEQSDIVRIMSIHKSKGLEFPIVFVSGLGKKFNMSDSKGSVVIHPELGVGIDAVDLEKRTKIPTFVKKVIQKEIQIESLGEELRVLYVAMTRAKEKLIMTGQLKNAEQILEHSLSYSGDISFYELTHASKYLDWILKAVSGNQASVKCSIWNYEDAALVDQVENEGEIIAKDVLEHWNTEETYDRGIKEHLEQLFSYHYPYEIHNKQKLKFTVSELKKRQYMEEESGEQMYSEPETVPLIPGFMKENKELKGASRGSIYHKLLELLDFNKKYDKVSLDKEIQQFVREEKFTVEMAECICREDILHFLESDIAIRMHLAAQKGHLNKEQPFVLGIDAEEIYQGEGKGETILVQGIIDVFFEEDGEIVLLDYKTDQVYAGRQLVERYQGQLDYYAKALEQLLQKKVKEKIIYSFTLGKEIHCK